MRLFDAVSDRLKKVELELVAEPVAPFGKELPLVSGWVVDPRTGLLVFVAECGEEWSESAWRDVLFAISGVRHSLADGDRTALGPPVLLALMDEERSERNLLRLIEALARDFVLFGRMDVSLVCDSRVFADGELQERELDYALAPLLPVCREALLGGSVIDARALLSFREELGRAVDATAARLRPQWGEWLGSAPGELREALCAAVAVPEEADAVEPWTRVAMEGFRAAEDLDAPLAGATIVDGLNGTGKSSLFEAAEVLWTGGSTRKPADVDQETYDKHLRRRGDRPFRLQGFVAGGEESLERTGLKEEPSSLGRCVLHQDSLRRPVELDDRERYAWFLGLTGLRIPELRELGKGLQRDAFEEVNRALLAFGSKPLARVNGRFDNHFQTELERGLEWEPGAPSEEARSRLGEVLRGCGWKYLPRDHAAPEEFTSRVRLINQRCLGVAESFRGSPDLGSEALSLVADLEDAAGSRRKEADAIRVLTEASERREATRPSAPAARQAEVPPVVAVRWLRSAKVIESQATELGQLLDRIPDPEWRERLRAYVGSLHAARREVPWERLRQFVDAEEPEREKAEVSVEPHLLDAIGLIGPGGAVVPTGVLPALGLLASRLSDEAAALDRLASEVLALPAVRLKGRERVLLEPAARFELARELEKPISEAETTVLVRVIGSQGLEEVFAELVAALTRFEWYFKPVRLSAKRNGMGFKGMVTEREELELRMLLNSGESSIVGLAWFLALHLLQGGERRRVLLLDDPFGGLDANNRAAALATLRSFVRLCAPDFFMVSTHDEVFGDLLAQEFCRVGEWPSSVNRLRFKRRADDNSICCEARPDTAEPPAMEAERARLRLGSNGGLRKAGAPGRA